MAALLCTFAMTAASIAPVTVMAEETETVTEAAAETEEAGEEADTEAAKEDDAEADAETETEAETEAVLPRPEYNALDYVTLG